MYQNKRFCKAIPARIFSLAFAMSLCMYAVAQVEVTGKVTSGTTNEALPGVTVSSKDNKVTATTDNNGSYRINVPGGTVLVFSYVGYTPREATVGSVGSINMVLSPNSSGLTEVVVIGYGERSKRDITGAVTIVNTAAIEKSTSMTPELALQGRAPGVFVSSGGGDPFSRPIVRIRGVNSFASVTDPLYVVDGVPLTEGGIGETGQTAISDLRTNINIFSMINPADIESMTVLKDASAASIYGVRAANGVILITTRKGKTGRPRVEVTSSYGTQNIPKKIDVLNTQQYVALYKEAYANSPTIDNGTPLPFGAVFGPEYDENDPKYLGNNPTYDWQDALLNKNAVVQDYSVRLSGANQSTNYYVSAGYGKTESPLKGNQLERFSIASNINSRVNKFIETGFTVRLNKSIALDNTKGNLRDQATAPPWQPIYDPNDRTGIAPVNFRNFVENPDYNPGALDPGPLFIPDPNADPNGLLYGSQTRYNPLGFQATSLSNFDLYRIIGNGFVVIEPIKGLKFRGSIGGDFYYNLRKEFREYDRERFSQTPENPYSGHDGNAKANYGERHSRNTNLIKDLTVNYASTFGDHSVDVLLGTSQQEFDWKIADLSSGQINFTEASFRNIPQDPRYTGGFTTKPANYSLVSYFGRLNYKFQEKYIVDFTLRRDGSSRFSPQKDYRWGTFPAVSVGWRISQEKFMEKYTWLNDLKIRASWGELGNDQNTRGFAYLSAVSNTPDYFFGSGGGNPFGTQLQGASFPNFPNQELKWETLQTTGLGFDAIFLNNKFNLTVEYYNKKTVDIIQSVLLVPSIGIEAPADVNVATVQNRGVEFQLGYNEKFGPVGFNASVNFTTVDNKILKLNNGNAFGDEFGRFEEGYSIGYLWGYKMAGIFQSQEEVDAYRAIYTDNNLSGIPQAPGDVYFEDVYGNPRPGVKEAFSPIPDSIINNSDRQFLGKTIPGFYYGVNLGANWKNFDLSVFFQGVGDVKKFNLQRADGEGMSSLGGNQWASTLNRWTPDNPSSGIPRAAYTDPAQNTRFSSRFVESAAFLRLKNLQVGYTLPKNVVTSLGFIDGLRVYFSGVNLFTLTDWTGYDPETDGMGDNYLVPPSRQLIFGLNASF